MPDSTDRTDKPDQPRISPPPSKEAVDEISRDQALITDEWAPTPAPEPSKPA